MARYDKGAMAEKIDAIQGNSCYRGKLIGSLSEDWQANICHAAGQVDDAELARLVVALKGSKYSDDSRVMVVSSDAAKGVLLGHLLVVQRVLGRVFVKTCADAAREMARGYVSGRYGELRAVAKSEGWLRYLSMYLMDTALTQAQLICGVRHVGFTVPVHVNTAERMEKYLGFCRKQAEVGVIHVPVTAEFVEVARGRVSQGVDAEQRYDLTSLLHAA